MIGDNLESYTFENLLRQALSEVPDSLDKRQGSVIYDALAPACARIAELFMSMRNIYKDTYVSTATEEALDNRAAEQGLTRYAATYALKKATFVDSEGSPLAVTLGARFSTISDIEPVIYYVESQYVDGGVAVAGAYNLRCEAAGTVGNEYSGPLTNITHIKGLAAATMSDLITPARNEESDDELRARYFDTVNNKAYGGNIAQYNQVVRDIAGVGDVQIYPVWNGGGTVKLSVVSTDLNPCSQDFLRTLKQQIDPEEFSGKGMGVAPIGHSVTLSTPEELLVDITMDVTIHHEYSMTQIEPLIKTALSDYFQSVRREWGVETPSGNYSVVVYVARILVSVLQITGIANVTNVKLNGSSADLVLTESGQLQQLPKLGEVTINA